MPRTSAPGEFIQVDVAKSLGAARHPMMKRLDSVLTRHGGTQSSDEFFNFPSRKAARAAALSENPNLYEVSGTEPLRFGFHFLLNISSC